MELFLVHWHWQLLDSFQQGGLGHVGRRHPLVGLLQVFLQLLIQAPVEVGRGGAPRDAHGCLVVSPLVPEELPGFPVADWPQCGPVHLASGCATSLGVMLDGVHCLRVDGQVLQLLLQGAVRGDEVAHCGVAGQAGHDVVELLLGHVFLVVIDKLTSVSFIQNDDSEIKGILFIMGESREATDSLNG